MRKKGCLSLFAVLLIVYVIINAALRLAASEAPSDAIYEGQPAVMVIAHQGGEHLRPSNTMAAFEHAVAMGVDMLEMDINGTRDGVLVTIHDTTVDRTTNGSGVVWEMSSAELLQLDAGYYFTRDDGQTYPYRGQGITIATLDEVFTAFPDMPMNIEIKQVEPSIATPFCDLLRQYDRAANTIVASFHQTAMDEFRAACPETPTSLTAGEVTNLYIRHRLLGAGAYTPPAGAIQIPRESAGIALLVDHFVTAAQRRNLQVHAWTINEPDAMRELIDLGVDGIITDRPDLLLEILGR